MVIVLFRGGKRSLLIMFMYKVQYNAMYSKDVKLYS